MRVLFNQMATLQAKTGVGHYAHQLRQHLSQRPDCDLCVFPADRRMRWIRNLHRGLAVVKSLPSRLHGQSAASSSNAVSGESGSRKGLHEWARERYRRWVEHEQRKSTFSDRFDLYHEPNFIPLPSSLPVVATIHDLSVLLHPEWHPAERVQWYEERFARGLDQLSHVITVSEFTRQQVMGVLGLSNDRVTSVPNGPRAEFRPLPTASVTEFSRRRGLPARYLLYVGTIEPRKNILRLMQAYISLPAAIRRDCPLILVGGWGWNFEAERTFYEEVAIHEGVRHLGYLPDDDLPVLFNGARALLYPSLYEGFGLPPLEMMACGGAVLASRIPPHVEVAGGAAHLIAPEDVEGWRAAMAKVILDDDWRLELCQSGAARAKLFSWARSARETAQVYHRVLSRDASRHSMPHDRIPIPKGQHEALCQSPRADAA